MSFRRLAPFVPVALSVVISLGLPSSVRAGDGDAMSASGAATRLADDLRATETAFAATMAARDKEAFAAFLDPGTIFFAGDKEQRSAATVLESWSRFFEGPDAPFSWEPKVVSVLDSGALGLTSGPVYDPEGNVIGQFNSIWQRSPDGSWKIVFDRGCAVCD
ncbi:MAG: nuclear transport factor 2 family protein [Candidatus Eisenbacteria bacterium]